MLSGVVVETLCSDLSEPKVMVTVLPELYDIILSVDTQYESIYIGYECEGSVSISRNISDTVREFLMRERVRERDSRTNPFPYGLVREQR